MHPLIQPIQPLALEMSRAMDTGIVQHHDGKGVRRLLDNQAVEGADDHLGGDGRYRRVVDQLALTTQEAQHVQELTMLVGRHFPGVADRAPGVR